MITINKKFDGVPLIINDYSTQDIVLFDIETTGFVANKSYLYLIGCCYYKDNSWQLIQWFAQNIADEHEVIKSFLAFIKDFKVIIHFNGTTFDIPYVTYKCMFHNFPFSFETLYSIDLYKHANALKSLLHFDRCNQRALEKTLNITRKDPFTGGDLIQTYANYVGIAQLEKLQQQRNGSNKMNRNTAYTLPETSADELLNQLLLHNEEDLIGLQALTCLLSYHSLSDGYYKIQNFYLDSLDHICFSLSLFQELPISFQVKQDDIEIIGKDDLCMIRVSLYEGTLKYYISDYKNYYYLPLEDSIIHKSIGNSIDKEYRKPAKKDNCYIKKTSIFLPQYQSTWEPVFSKEYKDTIHYFECSDELLKDNTFLMSYTKELLTHLLFPKKSKDK